MSQTNVDPKDIPFMPGTAFPDPHRTNFPVSHSLDMDHRIKTHDDEKALAAPTGLTSAYTATLAPIDYDERRALRTTWTMRQPADYLQWGEGHAKSMTVRGEFLRTTRGAIGCRTNSLNALMASGVRPDATLLPRTHEEERQFARSIPKFKPEHAVLDRVVMRFFAWFMEDVFESQSEKRRIRHVFIDYYLADRTIQIQERPVKNSGIPQGDLIKRHRIPRDHRDASAGFLSFEDLRVGDAVCIYSKVFYIYGCNDSTRQFLECQAAPGEMIPPNLPPESIPQDPYLAERQATEIAVMRKTHVTQHVPEEKLAKFLRHDREVLRFYAIWDNRHLVYGELRQLIIHFFLADDTVEVLEVLPQNSGRDPFPAFLRRQKVPKQHTMTQFAEHSLVTNEFFGARDFRIGSVISIYGRPVYIYDCDNYTREYMVRELGYSPQAVQPINKQELLSAPAQQMSLTQPANLMGKTRADMSALFPADIHHIGADVDTVGSCISIHPDAPRTDVLRWIKFGNLCLRFLAKFAPCDCNKPVHITQADRQFVISYFFSDGTVSVFEPTETTTPGFGYKFLERSRVVNEAATDAQNLEGTGLQSKKKIYIDFTDLDVGKMVVLNAHCFEIVEADERTKRIMEALQQVGNDLNKFDPKPFFD